MTDLTNTVRTSLKEKKAIIGYKQSIKFIRMETPKLIIMAKNIPEKMRAEIEHGVKVSNVPVEFFDGSSKDLGILCGKPFPVTTIVIRE